MKSKTYKQAINYLESFIGRIIFKVRRGFKGDPLERMRILLSLLGNPQNKFPSILVGGTAGKGSTAYLISHILTNAGYKTGFTISPHLEKINERIQLNGRQINNEQFRCLVNDTIPAIETMRQMSVGEPSYFEILIAMAFLYFSKVKVDIAVVEVGLGGEFDATNTLNPLIAVITNVSLDHTEILGNTVEKIARTKAGIIKSYCHSEHIRRAQCKLREESLPCRQAGRSFRFVSLKGQDDKRMLVITGAKQELVIKIIEKRCREADSDLYILGRNFDYKIKNENIDGIVFNFRNEQQNISFINLTLSMIGSYQVENASLAIEAVLALEKFGFKVSEGGIRKALKTAAFSGRFETLRLVFDKLKLAQGKMSATLILDGAHNPTKMRAFVSSLEKLYPSNPSSLKLRRTRKIFVVAFKKDKDVKGMLKEILSVADSLVVTEFRAKTDMSKNAAMEVDSIKYRKKNIETYFIKNSLDALKKAFEIANEEDLIVVTGSLYLVGEVRYFLFAKT